jgi:nicotinamidase-related amidase
MTTTTDTYPADRTALLMVDPYNDFMSPGGKLYDGIKDIAEANGMFDNMRKILAVVRAAGMQLFVVPHHRSQEGDFDHWRHMCAIQTDAHNRKAFEAGSWGGEFNPEFGPQRGDVVIYEHMAQNGFTNTNLELQLNQHNIDKLILVGMVANSCIESTGRHGMELGYHITLVRDATAAFNKDQMHAAHEVNGPAFAHAILTTEELLAKLPIAVHIAS